MADSRLHLDTVADVTPSIDGCGDCLRIDPRRVHVRLCMRSGQDGCCDDSPNRHATAHLNAHHDYPLFRSSETGEDWLCCYPDQLLFEVEGALPSPSHT